MFPTCRVANAPLCGGAHQVEGVGSHALARGGEPLQATPPVHVSYGGGGSGASPAKGASSGSGSGSDNPAGCSLHASRHLTMGQKFKPAGGNPLRQSMGRRGGRGTGAVAGETGEEEEAGPFRC